jgi:lipid-A-disaccharide synthase
LLPGSRRGEVTRHLPLLLAAAKRIAWEMPGVQFLVPKAAGLPAELFASCARAGTDVTVVDGRIEECYQAMEAAIIASGTSTVEAALYGVPMVVVYRTSWPKSLAAKSVMRVPSIAMVNVMAGRQIVPEFVQHRATPRRLAGAMAGLLRDEGRKEQMRQRYGLIREQLGEPGAVDRAAAAVLAELK